MEAQQQIAKDLRKKEWKHLREKFPVLKNNLPLKIGIFEDLAPHLKFTGRKSLKKLICWHTGKTAYLKNLSTMSMRFNLGMSFAAAVSKEHKQHAIERLKACNRKCKKKVARIAPMVSEIKPASPLGAVGMGMPLLSLKKHVA